MNLREELKSRDDFCFQLDIWLFNVEIFFKLIRINPLRLKFIRRCHHRVTTTITRYHWNKQLKVIIVKSLNIYKWNFGFVEEKKPSESESKKKKKSKRKRQ